MVWIRSERFPLRTVKKLDTHSASPFQILKKLNANAYIIDLPNDFGISSTFNDKDLWIIRILTLTQTTHWCEPKPEPIIESPSFPSLSDILPNTPEEVDKIRDD